MASDKAILGASEDPVDHNSQAKRHVLGSLKRISFLALSAFFFGLAVLGVIAPGIPATPFLLLTSYFLVRSSPTLNARLLRSRIFGPILVDWQVHGGVRTHVRCKAIIAVVLAVTTSIYLAGYSRVVSLTLISLATAGIIVILRLPTARDKQ